MSYDFETTVQIDDVEYDVTVTYKVTYWGSPGSGPSFSHPGDPPEGPEFDIESIETTDGTQINWDNLSEFDQNKIDDGIYEAIADHDHYI